MNTNQRWIAVASAALAGGLLSAYFIAPESFRSLRRNLAEEAHRQSRRLGSGLEEVEARLADLETQLQQTADELGMRVADATQRTLEHYIPEGSPPPEEWRLTRSDVNRSLPRLPGG